MIDLDAIEARANAATPGPWRDQHHECSEVWGPAPDSQTHSMQIARIGRAQFDVLNAAFIAHARTDVPALIARVRELEAERDQALADYQDLGRVMHEECARLEAECERQSTLAATTFNALIANDIAQMRAYGLSYEGVRALLGDFDDGDITFAKLMDLIRAAARVMAEEECAALRALLVDAHRELATIEAITVSPSGVDGLIELVNRIGQKLESSK